MSIRDAVRSILGIQPVKVADLAAAVTPTPVSRPSTRPAGPADPLNDVEVIHEYGQVRSLLAAGVPLVFVTGGAGTGKSTLIRYLTSSLRAQLAVVAPTGVAALNAGGTTIHSFFRFPPRLIQHTDIKRIRDRDLYSKLELLIVDEASMVRPDLLDGIDRFLRVNRDRDAPFGGVQVLLVGDLYQLPPVVSDQEQAALRLLGYQTDFFFSASGVADCSLVPVVLTRPFRQTDAEFVALLNDLREGRADGAALDRVNERSSEQARAQDGEIVLTCTNRSADLRNEEEIARIHAIGRTYTGSITGEFKVGRARLPAPMELWLKPGAQVMFTKNDGARRWVNGSLGRVVSLEAGAVKVELDGPSTSDTFEVEPVTWDQHEYRFDPEQGRIVPTVVGRYTQLPLVLAWAVTIHKAQGKTLDRVLVDLGAETFAAGQVYVALSRVRNLECLRLTRPIREDDVRCHPDVTRFYRHLGEMTRIT